MTLIHDEGDKTGRVARVPEVLYDGLCARGRASRVLRMVYPTGEENKPEPAISALDPTARTCGRPGTKRQTEQGAEQGAKQETKTSPLGQTSQSCRGPTTGSQTRKAAGQETKQEAKNFSPGSNHSVARKPETTSQKKQGAKQKAKQGDGKISMSFTSSTYWWPSDMSTIEESHVTPTVPRSDIPPKFPSWSELVWSSSLETNTTGGDYAFAAVKYSWC